MDIIEIRKYKPQDILGFYEAVIDSKKEISKWLPWCDKEYSINETKNWILTQVPEIWKSGKGCEFIIAKKEERKVVGGCCLEQINMEAKEASIGYWVRSSYTGQGIATTACLFLLKYGFVELGLELIKVIPSEENIASIKVAEKLPYVEKRTVKNGFKIRDRVSNAAVYLITKESFEQGLK